MAGQEVARAPTISPFSERQDQVSRVPSFSPTLERQDQSRKHREMQNEQHMSAQVDTQGQTHERSDFVNQEHEVQRGRTLSTSPPSVEGENDSDFQPPARSKSQADGEPMRRISTRRKAVEDDEYEPSRSSKEPSTEMRKRKAGSPQVQIPVKKSKTSRAQSEAGESVIVVGAPDRDETVVETTETGDSQPSGHTAQRQKVPNDKYSRNSQQDESETMSEGSISKEEHDRLFEEKRAEYNEKLQRQLQTKKELQAKLQQTEEDRDNYQNEALKSKIKLDRMIQQEDKWFEKVPERIREWKKKEIAEEARLIREWADKELQKEKNKMRKRFQSQESRHKKEQADSSENVKKWKAEITENRRQYETLEKQLKKDADQRIKEMKPENQKELRERKKENDELHVQLKTLEAELQKTKDEYQDIRSYAKEKKADVNALRDQVVQLQNEKNQALDTASTAEANFRSEKRHGNDLARQFKTALQQQQQKYNLLNQNNTESQDALAGNQRSLFFMRQQNERNNAKVERLEKEVEALRKEKGAVEWKLQQQNPALKKDLEEKRSLSAPMTNKPQAQRQETRSPAAAMSRPSRSPSLHQGQQSHRPSASSPQDVSLHRHAQASSMGSDRHRQSVPDPRTGSTGQGVRDQDDTAAKDSKVVETVKEVHPQAEPKEGRPVDYRRLEGRDGGGKEDLVRGAGGGGDVVGGVRVGEDSEGAAMPAVQQSSLFGHPGKQAVFTTDRDSAGGGDDAMEGVRVGQSPEVAAAPPKREPSASIFGMNRPAATTDGASAGVSGDTMEGLNLEGTTETAKVDTGEDHAPLPAGGEPAHTEQRKGPYGQYGSAANVVSAPGRLTLGDFLADNPYTAFNRWGWQQ